jgi:nicotinamide phosphoribosyltransferase
MLWKELDPHIGAIYGDSITRERAVQICERLKEKGFASTNLVLGIGSNTYQFNTRDTFGFAMKTTYSEVNGQGREIYKDPVTDDGTKKSAKGWLKIEIGDGVYPLLDRVTPAAGKRRCPEDSFSRWKTAPKSNLNRDKKSFKII